jgi:hypothetical protein
MELHLAQLKRPVDASSLDLAEWDAYCNLQNAFVIVPDSRPSPYTTDVQKLRHERSRPRAVLRAGEMAVVLRWMERVNDTVSANAIEVSYSDGYRELAVQIAEKIVIELNCLILDAPHHLLRVEEQILRLDGFAAFIHTTADVHLCEVHLTTWEDSGRVHAFLIDQTRMRFLEGLCVWSADEIVAIEKSNIRLADVRNIGS